MSWQYGLFGHCSFLPLETAHGTMLSLTKVKSCPVRKLPSALVPLAIATATPPGGPPLLCNIPHSICLLHYSARVPSGFVLWSLKGPRDWGEIIVDLGNSAPCKPRVGKNWARQRKGRKELTDVTEEPWVREGWNSECHLEGCRKSLLQL